MTEKLVFAAIFTLVLAGAPAFAYLDPGTGSLMLQLALGGVAGAMVVGKLYLRKASDFFRHFGRRRKA